MNWLLLALAFALAFIPTAYYMPHFIGLLRTRKELLRPDMNKAGKPLVPALGGIALVTGFMFSLASVVLISVLFSANSVNLAVLLPAMLTLALIALLGLVDDIIVIPKRFTKPILTLYASIPMMALAGLNTVIYLPLFGGIDFGILYGLVFVPLAIVFCANAVNILSTYNGIEAGMGLVAAFGIFLAAYIKGEFTGMLIAVPFIAVLIVFLRYNMLPAKIFPGNVGALFIGGALAVAAILGNVERTLVIIMIPYFAHFLLYSRNLFRWKPEMWGVPQKNGTLKCGYNRPYGIMHWLIMNRQGMTEKKVVYSLIALEALFAAAAVMAELTRLRIPEVFAL
ncbi:MAG: hypothetical protein V1676_06515 [Candidatus Diapherotrites archaeon]